MRRVLLWLCLALVGRRAAFAHPAPFSYVDVRLSGASIELTVTVHEFDVAHDLGVEDASRLLNASELARYSAALTELLKDRLQVWVGGQRLTGGWSPAVALPDRQAIQLRVVTTPGIRRRRSSWRRGSFPTIRCTRRS